MIKAHHKITHIKVTVAPTKAPFPPSSKRVSIIINNIFLIFFQCFRPKHIILSPKNSHVYVIYHHFLLHVLFYFAGVRFPAIRIIVFLFNDNGIIIDHPILLLALPILLLSKPRILSCIAQDKNQAKPSIGPMVYQSTGTQ